MSLLDAWDELRLWGITTHLYYWKDKEIIAHLGVYTTDGYSIHQKIAKLAQDAPIPFHGFLWFVKTPEVHRSWIGFHQVDYFF